MSKTSILKTAMWTILLGFYYYAGAVIFLSTQYPPGMHYSCL